MDPQFIEPSETNPATYHRAAAAASTVPPDEPGVPDGKEVPDDPAEELPIPSPVDAYYDAERREYLMKNQRGVWLPLTESQYKRHLRQAGITAKAMEGQTVSPADELILHLQHTRDIQYAGRLCGKTEGFYKEGRTRFLVTESFHLPEPSPGNWPNLRAVFQGLLGSDALHGQTQMDVFHGWMQTGQLALRAGRIQAAQALAVAGPSSCGKSLLQGLITVCLGGRAAKPYRYMTGGTDFNGELFEAEHLMLEDEFMSRRLGDRQKLAAALKNLCVATRTASCHRKNRQAINLPAWWRLSISLNDDPEAMMVLPPLDDHVADKLILLRASTFPFPMPMDTAEAQERFMEVCKAEVPAYLHWLINDYRIPQNLADPCRYGIVSWHHPELQAGLNNLSPEADLLALVDEVLWELGAPEWRGTTEELQCQLFDSHVGQQARKLLDWRNACGTYLGRLSTKPNPRVKPDRTATRREYIIKAPQNNSQ